MGNPFIFYLRRPPPKFPLLLLLPPLLREPPLKEPLLRAGVLPLLWRTAGALWRTDGVL